jgi:hypothetical protein
VKKLINKFLLAALISGFAIPIIPMAPANAVEISGFDQLSECVRSEGTSNLNLFFLIDSSMSLKVRDRGRLPGTDPNDLRANILSQSIRQIADLNSDSVKVSFALTTFDKTSPGKGGKASAYPWTEASTDNAAKASNWVERVIPDQDNGPYTDWRAGLKEAQKQLSQAPKGSGATCKAIIWFTDGELDVNGSAQQNAQAIAEMCGVTPTDSTAKGDNGIVPSLRRDGVILIGVLLRAGEGQTGEGLVTYFAPIVLGAGSVDSRDFGGDSKQSFECGTNPIPQSYGHGSVIVATNPDDLAREFLKMIFIIKNGSPLPTNSNDEFTIDPGVSQVSILIPSDKWVIQTPGEIGLIANNSKDSRFTIGTFGRTSTVVFDVTNDFLGKWKVEQKGSDNENITVFMKSGLRISVDKNLSTLTAGAGAQDVSGYIKKGNEVADLSVYNQSKTSMTITAIDSTNKNRDAVKKVMTIDPEGSWYGLFSPLDGAEKGAMKMSLQLVTKSGVVLPVITQTYTFDLVLPKALCQIKSSNLKLSDLVYKPHAAASGRLQVTGGNSGNCAIAFQTPVVESDPLGRTTQDFTFSITDEENGQLVQLGEWRQIESGALKTYIVTLDNPLKSNGQSMASLPIQRRTVDSQQFVESTIELSFLNVTQSKNLLPILFGLLALGLAIPFGILQLVNFLFARFRLGTASIAVVRVKAEVLADDRVNLKPIDETKPLLSEKDFDSMPVHQSSEKSFNAETRNGDVVAKLRAKLPINPFGNVSGVVVANSGEIVSSSETPRNTPGGGLAGASLNPNGYFFLTAPKNAELNESESGTSYEATLTAFITDLVPGDPDARVKNLLDTIQQSDIWNEMAQLLSAKPVEKAAKDEKSVKANKGKKSKKETSAKSESAESDPWDSDSTSSYSPAKESSSRSKPSESAKPATSPAVDEDDPWA